MRATKAILVTGSPRSGTTWVGRVLASTPKTTYVLEPLNLCRADYFGLPVSRWYPRLTCHSDPRFEHTFKQILSGQDIGRMQYHRIHSAATPIEAVRQLAWQIRDRFIARRAERVIVKDPIAILSADWFANQFGAEVLVTIRHPAAVASSVRLQGWSPSFCDLIHEPEVVDRFFPDIHAWLRRNPLHRGHDEMLYRASVFWRLLHRVILRYRQDYPNWNYVRHEDLSRNAHGKFAELFHKLGLPLTSSTTNFIDHTTSTNSYDYIHQPAPTDVVVRDTATNIDAWRERLTDQEITQVRRLTGDVADEFYATSTWN